MSTVSPLVRRSFFVIVLGLSTGCDDPAVEGPGEGVGDRSTSQIEERPAQTIESPIGDFTVELPPGFGKPLWKAKGPTDVNFAAASGKRTLEVRSSPNRAKESELLDTSVLFRMACNAVESNQETIVDYSQDLQVDGQMARIYRTHPADRAKTGAVQMMFVASEARFYAVSMAAPDASEFERRDAKAFFDSFHVRSPVAAPGGPAEPG